MKRTFFLLPAFAFMHALSQDQAFRVGVFDLDRMVQAMPAYHATVDSLLQTYANDSLSQEYVYYQQEYARVDSSYKIDSA